MARKPSAKSTKGNSEANGQDPIPRHVLPVPDVTPIALTTFDAKDPDTKYPPIRQLRPPPGAPNVLLVLIDDAGFGNPSGFGGPIRNLTLERMAEGGLKYNRFHVTALCSPTRAALMTGRNHHSVGFGMVSELAGPFPGYSSTLPKDSQPFPKTLQGNGYSTACFGKWHLTPDHLQGPAGPCRWSGVRCHLPKHAVE